MYYKRIWAFFVFSLYILWHCVSKSISKENTILCVECNALITKFIISLQFWNKCRVKTITVWFPKDNHWHTTQVTYSFWLTLAWLTYMDSHCMEDSHWSICWVHLDWFGENPKYHSLQARNAWLQENMDNTYFCFVKIQKVSDILLWWVIFD